MTTEELFLKWWGESYPHAKPAPHTIFTHVGFADYVDQVRTQDVLDALGRNTTEE